MLETIDGEKEFEMFLWLIKGSKNFHKAFKHDDLITNVRIFVKYRFLRLQLFHVSSLIKHNNYYWRRNVRQRFRKRIKRETIRESYKKFKYKDFVIKSFRN